MHIVLHNLILEKKDKNGDLVQKNEEESVKEHYLRVQAHILIDRKLLNMIKVGFMLVRKLLMREKQQRFQEQELTNPQIML